MAGGGVPVEGRASRTTYFTVLEAGTGPARKLALAFSTRARRRGSFSSRKQTRAFC